MEKPAFEHILQKLNGEYRIDGTPDAFDRDEIRMLLYTLDKESLQSLKQELEFSNYRYRDAIRYTLRCIDKMLSPVEAPQRNEEIGTLIRLFRDKKSKKVTYAKEKLKERYAHQSHATQRKIIDAFLDGAMSDRKWAFNILYGNWDSHFAGKIDALWQKQPEEACRRVIVQHMSEEYLLQHQEAWKTCYSDSFRSCSAAYKYVCIRLANNPAFKINYDRLCEGDYYEVMAKTGGKVTPGDILGYLFRTIAEYTEEMESGDSLDTLFNDDIFLDDEPRGVDFHSKVNATLYSMALMKMENEMIYYFNWHNKVKTEFRKIAKEVTELEQRKRIYFDVIRQHLPEAIAGYPFNEQQLSPKDDEITETKKAKFIEELCDKNPVLAEMIDKLDLD